MSLMRKVLLILALVAVCDNPIAAQHLAIPTSLKFCPKSSPNMASCIKDSIEHLRPFLRTGDLGSGFKISGLEPFEVDDINLERGRGFFFRLYNIKAQKLSNFRIGKARVNFNNLDFEFTIEAPVIDATGNYKINMLLGIVQIKGEGTYISHLENVKMRIRMKATLHTQNGVEYLKFTHVETKVQIPKLTFQLHNLFKDKTLNDVSNNLINQNIHLFIKDVESSVESSLTKTAFKSGSEIVQHIPFNVLFP